MNYLTPILAVYALWLFFLAVMNLKRAADAGALSRPAYVLGVPILLIGYSLDVCVNVSIGTVFFLELPNEWTVTARLTRLKNHDAGWRGIVAAWVCINLLDKFDPSGCHCAEG